MKFLNYDSITAIQYGYDIIVYRCMVFNCNIIDTGSSCFQTHLFLIFEIAKWLTIILNHMIFSHTYMIVIWLPYLIILPFYFSGDKSGKCIVNANILQKIAQI